MRIVGPNRLGVQSLGRHSVGNTGFEGEAILARAIGDTVGGLMQQTSELMTHRQLQKAGLSAQEAQTQFNEEMADKIFFNVGDLPSDVVTPAMRARPDGRVTRAEVEPALYKKHMKSSLAEISKTIDIPSARADWEGRMQENGLRHLEGLQNKASSEMKRQYFESQKFDWDKAIKEGKWDRAKEIADGMYGTEEEKEFYINTAMEGKEVQTYVDSMVQENIQEITSHINVLSQSEEDYRGDGGQLNIEDRLSMKHALEREYIGLTKTNVAENKKIEQQLRYDVATVMDNATKNKMTDVQEMLGVHKRLQAWNAENEDDKHKLMLELEDAIKLAQFKDVMVQNNRNNRDGVLSQGTIQIEGWDGARNDKLNNGLRAVNEKMTNLENVDSMQAWDDAGFFGVNGLEPVNWNDSSSIANRMEEFETAQQNYNFPGQGPLKSDEAKAITQELDKAGPKKQLSFLQSNANALGLKSTILYKQLANEGDAGSLSIAGVNVSYGNIDGAEKILRGREYNRKNYEKVNEFGIKDTLNAEISKELGTLYWDIPKKKDAVNEAILDAYVGIKAPSGDFRSFDKDAYQQAVNIATGGTFEQGGFVLPNPEFGMPPDTMEKWIAKTDASYIKETSGSPITDISYVTGESGNTVRMGTVVNIEDFWSDVQDGKYGLQTSSDTKEYIVINPDGSAVQGTEGPFKIKYDATATEQSRRGIVEVTFGSEMNYRGRQGFLGQK